MAIKKYYQLVKPGIVYGNSLTSVAGYLFASRLHFNWFLFVARIIGYALVIAAAGVINNLYDRDIDQQMARTKNRPSVNGDIDDTHGFIYGLILLIIGIVILILWTTSLCVLIASIGFIVYVSAYTISKRYTHYSTIIGSIAGATPIVGGYVAFSGHLTVAALILGLMMFIWQIPHFYAIAIFRKDDYAKAKVPVLSIVHGNKVTSLLMLIFSVLYLVASLSLYFQSKLSVFYLIIMSLIGLLWIVVNIRGVLIKAKLKWSRQSFFVSLIVVMVMSLMVALR